MQVAKIFTFSFVAGQTITCTYWTYDWERLTIFKQRRPLIRGLTPGWCP